MEHLLLPAPTTVPATEYPARMPMMKNVSVSLKPLPMSQRLSIDIPGDPEPVASVEALTPQKTEATPEAGASESRVTATTPQETQAGRKMRDCRKFIHYDFSPPFVSSESSQSEVEVVEGDTSEPRKKKRGRPKKTYSVEEKERSLSPAKEQKKKGRKPIKSKSTDESLWLEQVSPTFSESSGTSAPEVKSKKKRGRPPKVRLAQEPSISVSQMAEDLAESHVESKSRIISLQRQSLLSRRNSEGSQDMKPSPAVAALKVDRSHSFDTVEGLDDITRKLMESHPQLLLKTPDPPTAEPEVNFSVSLIFIISFINLQPSKPKDPPKMSVPCLPVQEDSPKEISLLTWNRDVAVVPVQKPPSPAAPTACDSSADSDSVTDTNTDPQPNSSTLIVRKRVTVQRYSEPLMNIVDQLPKPSTSLQSVEEDEDRPETPPPGTCTIYQENLDLLDGMKVLTRIGPHFYPGKVTAVEGSSIFAVNVEGERGNKPHIYPAEELLQKTLLEVKPVSRRYTPVGSRVCVLWSSKLNFLYPGTVKSFTSSKQFVLVELDDGDQREIHVDNIRLLPKSYPKVVSKSKRESPLGAVEDETMTRVPMSEISPSGKKRLPGKPGKLQEQQRFHEQPRPKPIEEPVKPKLEIKDATLSADLLKDGLRILNKKNGHFYPGRLNAVRPPDIYGILLDNERGFRPTIYAREELLEDAIREIRVKTAELPMGTRVCAYWSAKYHFLHPGTVIPVSCKPLNLHSLHIIFFQVSDTVDKNAGKYLNVELDDGDVREVHIEQLRLLPQNYPKLTYTDPLLSPSRKKGSSRPNTPRDGTKSDQSRPSSALSNVSDVESVSSTKSELARITRNPSFEAARAEVLNDLNGLSPPPPSLSPKEPEPKAVKKPFNKIFIPEPPSKPVTTDLVGLISRGIDKLVDKKVVGNRRPPTPLFYPAPPQPSPKSSTGPMVSPLPPPPSPTPLTYPSPLSPGSERKESPSPTPPLETGAKAKSRLSSLIEAMSGKIKKPEGSQSSPTSFPTLPPPPSSTVQPIQVNKWMTAFNVKPTSPVVSPSKERLAESPAPSPQPLVPPMTEKETSPRVQEERAPEKQTSKFQHKHNILLGYDFVDENDSDIMAWDKAVSQRKKTEKPKILHEAEIKQETEEKPELANGLDKISPSGQLISPSSGQFIPPPSEQFIAPPMGQFIAPPMGQFIAPPMGQFIAPPMGQFIAPPMGQFIAPQIEQFIAPPMGQFTGPPSEQYLQKEVNSTMDSILNSVTDEEKMRLQLLSAALRKYSPIKQPGNKSPRGYDPSKKEKKKKSAKRISLSSEDENSTPGSPKSRDDSRRNSSELKKSPNRSSVSSEDDNSRPALTSTDEALIPNQNLTSGFNDDPPQPPIETEQQNPNKLENAASYPEKSDEQDMLPLQKSNTDNFDDLLAICEESNIGVEPSKETLVPLTNGLSDDQEDEHHSKKGEEELRQESELIMNQLNKFKGKVSEIKKEKKTQKLEIEQINHEDENTIETELRCIAKSVNEMVSNSVEDESDDVLVTNDIQPFSEVDTEEKQVEAQGSDQDAEVPNSEENDPKEKVSNEEEDMLNKGKIQNGFVYRDPVLPEGWCIMMKRRENGKLDPYYITPCHKRLRSKQEVIKYLSQSPPKMTRASKREYPMPLEKMPFRSELSHEDFASTRDIEPSIFFVTDTVEVSEEQNFSLQEQNLEKPSEEIAQTEEINPIDDQTRLKEDDITEDCVTASLSLEEPKDLPTEIKETTPEPIETTPARKKGRGRPRKVVEGSPRKLLGLNKNKNTFNLIQKKKILKKHKLKMQNEKKRQLLRKIIGTKSEKNDESNQSHEEKEHVFKVPSLERFQLQKRKSAKLASPTTEDVDKSESSKNNPKENTEMETDLEENEPEIVFDLANVTISKSLTVKVKRFRNPFIVPKDEPTEELKDNIVEQEESGSNKENENSPEKEDEQVTLQQVHSNVKVTDKPRSKIRPINRKTRSSDPDPDLSSELDEDSKTEKKQKASEVSPVSRTSPDNQETSLKKKKTRSSDPDSDLPPKLGKESKVEKKQKASEVSPVNDTSQDIQKTSTKKKKTRSSHPDPDLPSELDEESKIEKKQKASDVSSVSSNSPDIQDTSTKKKKTRSSDPDLPSPIDEDSKAEKTQKPSEVSPVCRLSTDIQETNTKKKKTRSSDPDPDLPSQIDQESKAQKSSEVSPVSPTSTGIQETNSKKKKTRRSDPDPDLQSTLNAESKTENIQKASEVSPVSGTSPDVLETSIKKKKTRSSDSKKSDSPCKSDSSPGKFIDEKVKKELIDEKVKKGSRQSSVSPSFTDVTEANTKRRKTRSSDPEEPDSPTLCEPTPSPGELVEVKEKKEPAEVNEKKEQVEEKVQKPPRQSSVSPSSSDIIECNTKKRPTRNSVPETVSSPELERKSKEEKIAPGSESLFDSLFSSDISDPNSRKRKTRNTELDKVSTSERDKKATEENILKDSKALLLLSLESSTLPDIPEVNLRKRKTRTAESETVSSGLEKKALEEKNQIGPGVSQELLSLQDVQEVNSKKRKTRSSNSPSQSEEAGAEKKQKTGKQSPASSPVVPEVESECAKISPKLCGVQDKQLVNDTECAQPVELRSKIKIEDSSEINTQEDKGETQRVKSKLLGPRSRRKRIESSDGETEMNDHDRRVNAKEANLTVVNEIECALSPPSPIKMVKNQDSNDVEDQVETSSSVINATSFSPVPQSTFDFLLKSKHVKCDVKLVSKLIGLAEVCKTVCSHCNDKDSFTVDNVQVDLPEQVIYLECQACSWTTVRRVTTTTVIVP